MLFRMKDEKAHQLEAELDKLQADGPAAWAKLPEEELFTPAGFSEERAEATSYSNYSYWGSTFRAFFKNRVAVLLLVALIAVVAVCIFAALPAGQADPNLCAVDPATGIQYRNIAPGEKASSGVPTPSARTSGLASGRRPHQPDHRFLRGPHRGRGGHHGGCALGLCPSAGLLLH